MGLDGIVSNALTALETNTAALRTVSGNVANMNTPDYARRVVNEQVLVSGAQVSGVSVADVQRISDQYLMQEMLSANASSSQYATENSAFQQLNGALGQPGDGTALTTQLDNIFSALGNAALSPNSSTSQQNVLSSMQNFASSVSSLSSQISSLQGQTDQQVTSSIGTVNSLIQQVYTLNQQIQTANASGDTASGFLDQRDQALQNLSQYIDVRTVQQSNGQLSVMTQDGISLVGDTYAQLSYSGGTTNGNYGPIMLQTINPATGGAIGSNTVLDPHLGAGQLQGLIDMRDGTLSDLQSELGSFARTTALSFNAQNNANSAVPPPTTLSGSNTGLLSSDALNFSGKTTIAVTDSSGNLVSRIDVDFGAGTLSVNGGAAASIGSTIGSFTTALNSALGGNGTASFTNGALSISANGGNGVVVKDDATTPSSRGGVGFSQFFGLNDLFKTSAPSILSTGLSASDAGGFAAGGSMSFTLKGPNGEVGKQASVTLTAGMTIGDVVTALNTSFGGAGNFTLNSDGSLGFAAASGYSGYTLQVNNDSTQRGSTGVSFTQLFGIGANQAANLASTFSVNPAITSNPSQLAFAQANITSSTTAGQSILGAGDNSGLLALQNLQSTNQSFAGAGALGAQSATLNAYADSFYQDAATRGATAQTNATTQSDRLTEAQSRQTSNSGVNLDEELTNMMTYQQAYSAGARMLTVVGQLYDTLLAIQ
ncbi:MAG TPA: flagellar hook-associated protein FlgK [Rhizomicrobium sp.]|nr:flagellar hook-associated protein FlgK [Rhizomicrobium sp.]